MPKSVLPRSEAGYTGAVGSQINGGFYDESMTNSGLTLVSYCPNCETSTTPSAAVLLGEKENANLLHLRCGSCTNSMVALIYISPAGISSTGLLTDLAAGEFSTFKAAPVISTDDVIDTHMILQNETDFWNKIS